MTKSKLKSTVAAFVSMIGYAIGSASIVHAEITNPAISETLGGSSNTADSGTVFIFYFILLWKAIIDFGALAMLVYFVWGSLDWVLSGGDKSKLETARNKITQAILGMIILAGSFVIIGYVNKIAFGENFNLLELHIPTAVETSAGSMGP